MASRRRQIAVLVVSTILGLAVMPPVMISPAYGAFGDILAECNTIHDPSLHHPAGPGAVALMSDGTYLYYTLVRETIFKITVNCIPVSSCTSPVGAIGALSFDPADGNAWAGSYGGTTRIWKLNPTTCDTVLPPFVATHGGITVGDISPAIDGLALDTSDGTLWWSSDQGKHIHHITTSNAIIGTCNTPPPFGAASGNAFNSGIAYNKVQDNLILVLFTGLAAKGIGLPYSIAEANKADSGTCTKIVEFDIGDYLAEDLEVDTLTFPGKLAVWSIETQFEPERARAWEIKLIPVGVPEFSLAAPVLAALAALTARPVRLLLGKKARVVISSLAVFLRG